MSRRPSRDRSALQKLYGCAVGSDDKGDTRAWADRHWLSAEHRALGFELSAYGVDVFNLKAEVIKALVWMCWAGAGLWIAADIQDEDVGTTKLKVDAWLALLRAADHLGAEHALIKGSRCLGVPSEKVDMVKSELVHRLLTVTCRTKFYMRQITLPRSVKSHQRLRFGEERSGPGDWCVQQQG